MEKLLLICLSVLGQVSAQREKSKFSNVAYDYNMLDKICDKLASDFNAEKTRKAVIANNQPGKFIKFLL